MVKRYLCRLGLLFFVFILLPTVALASSEVKLDRYDITINESTNLVVQAEEDAELPPDILQQLEQNFSVRNLGSSVQKSCVNFSCTSTEMTNYQLIPKNIGLFNIPSMTINGQKTASMQLSVRAANNNPNSANVDPIFIETDLEKTEAFVQEQVLLTFRVNHVIELQPRLELAQPFTAENATIKLIEQKNYDRRINQRRYKTAELTYAVFAQQSGLLEIPSIQLVATTSRGWNRNNTLRLRSEPQTLNIKAKPSNQLAQWLPAKGIQFNESWDSDINNITVGDSITRTIVTSAIGLASEQIPPINIKANNKFKTYADQAKLEDKHNQQGIVGMRTDTIAIVATQAGEITLPAIELDWWNTETEQQETAVLAPITLSIQPDPTAAPPQNPSNKPNEITSNNSDPVQPPPSQTMHMIEEKPENSLLLWQLSTLISSALALTFLVLWLYQKHQPDKHKQQDDTKLMIEKNLSEVLKGLKGACQAKNPIECRRHLLVWARLFWPEHNIRSLSDINRCSGLAEQTALSDFIAQLDAAAFTSQTLALDYHALFEYIAALNKHKAKADKALIPLYPQ